MKLVILLKEKAVNHYSFKVDCFKLWNIIKTEEHYRDVRTIAIGTLISLVFCQGSAFLKGYTLAYHMGSLFGVVLFQLLAINYMIMDHVRKYEHSEFYSRLRNKWHKTPLLYAEEENSGFHVGGITSKQLMSLTKDSETKYRTGNLYEGTCKQV